jgi:hypothetical protein
MVHFPKNFPAVVTHNYDPRRGAFRNICDLPGAEAQAILTQIRSSGQRKLKDNYLHRRLATEAWLIAERAKRLCRTRLNRAIYFFLGDFADGMDGSRPESFIMQLAEFSPNTVTFTYSDSMASFATGTEAKHMADRREYHGRVFVLDEIIDLVDRFGLPGDRWKTDHSLRYDKFVEVQVWDDKPIRRTLARGRQP